MVCNADYGPPRLTSQEFAMDNGAIENGSGRNTGPGMWRRPALTFPLLCLEAEFSPCSYAWDLRLCSIWSVLELEFYQGSGLFVLCACFLVVKLFCSDWAHTQPLSSSLRVENKKEEAGVDTRTKCSQGTVFICFIPRRMKVFGIFWNVLMKMPSGILRYTSQVAEHSVGP